MSDDTHEGGDSHARAVVDDDEHGWSAVATEWAGLWAASPNPCDAS